MSEVPWTFSYDPYKCPCKGCDKRVVGCHAVCEEYKVFRSKVDDTNKTIRKAKTMENIGRTK